MKTRKSISEELNEAKGFKLPSGHKELKRETEKVNGKPVDIVYSQVKGKVAVFVDGRDFTGTEKYKDLKTAEKEFKDIKQIMKNMGEELDISIEEIINEINI